MATRSPGASPEDRKPASKLAGLGVPLVKGERSHTYHLIADFVTEGEGHRMQLFGK